MKATQSFPYVPEIDYNKVDIHDSEKIVKYLKPFTKNKLFFIEIHAVTADALRKFIGSPQRVTNKIRNTFLENLKKIEDSISQIIFITSNLNKDLSDDGIRERAYKNYFREFEGGSINDRKLVFMELLSLYEVLKFNNVKLIDEWVILNNIFGEIEVDAENHEFLRQVLVYKIYPRIELTTLVDFLIKRISFILRISVEKMKETSCIASGEYSAAIQYSFSSVFDLKIANAIVQLNEFDANKGSDSEISDKNVLKNWKEAIGSCFVDDFAIDCSADEVFNQGQFQMMKINSYKLQIEELKLKKAVYIETNMGIEDRALRRSIARSFITESSIAEKIEQYDVFLNEYFNLQMSSLTVHFPTLNQDNHKLFLYHFTPTYFFRVIVYHMQELRVGFIHRFVKGSTIVRELPIEYTKLALCHWWDDNIYKKITRFEKNSREKYNNLINLLANLWEKEEPSVLADIKSNIHARRAFELHNLNVLRPFLQQKLSHLFYLLYARFLGQDFIYYSIKNK